MRRIWDAEIGGSLPPPLTDKNGARGCLVWLLPCHGRDRWVRCPCVPLVGLLGFHGTMGKRRNSKGWLAHLVEQRFVRSLVVGSMPTPPAKAEVVQLVE